MSPDNSAMTRVCVLCQKHIPDDANVCPHCGHDYRLVMTGQAWEEEKTPLPPIGGAIIALSGVSQVVSGLLWLFGFEFGFRTEEDRLEAIYWTIGLAMILVGAFAIAVSPFAMTRRRLVLSLAGGVAALGGGTLATMYTLSIATGSLGLVGLLLVAIARDEFRD